MTRGVRRVLFGLAGAVVIVAACLAVRVLIGRHRAKSVTPDFVPASWAQARTTPGHRTHVGAAKAECHDCHDFERDGFKNPGTAVCTKCHARETGVAHHGSPSRSTDCLTCHAFAIGRAEPTCIDCHARPEGLLPAVVQHATVDCTTCHRLHETPSIVPADCTSCHRERAPEHGEHAGFEGLPRLPPPPRACVRGEGRLRELPCAGVRTAPERPRRVPQLSRASQLRRESQRVRQLPRPQDHAGRQRGPGPRRLRELPQSARSRRGRGRLCAMPPGRPGESRERGRVCHVPSAPHGRSDRGRGHVHELSREGGLHRHRRAQRSHRLRGVPQAARLRGAGRKDPVPRLSRPRDHARRIEPRPCRLRVVPRRIGRACDCGAGALRHLPCRRTEVRARGPPALHRLPRAPRRAAHAPVRLVPCGQDPRAARGDPGRLRELPSPPRPRRHRRAPRLHDVPCAGHVTGAPCRAGPRGVRQLPRVAPRAATRRSRHVHGKLPHRPGRPRARRIGVHRLPRVPGFEPVTRRGSAHDHSEPANSMMPSMWRDKPIAAIDGVPLASIDTSEPWQSERLQSVAGV